MTRAILAIALLCAAQPALAQPRSWSHDNPPGHRRSDGVHLRVLRDYSLAAGARATEPIVVIGGSATIDGIVDEDIVVVGGQLRIGPTAVVSGDVVVVGEEAMISPQAQISGSVDQSVLTLPELRWLSLTEGWWAVLAFGFLLLRTGFTGLLSILLTLVAPRWVQRISSRAGAPSLLIGAAGELLFLPLLVVVAIALAISVLGIPLLALLPLAIGALLVVWVAGFAAVSARLGARVRGRDPNAPAASHLDVLTGVMLVSATSFVAHVMALGPQWMAQTALVAGIVGLAIEFAAWTAGLGAAIFFLLGARDSQPPALPLPTPTPAAM